MQVWRSVLPWPWQRRNFILYFINSYIYLEGTVFRAHDASFPFAIAIEFYLLKQAYFKWKKDVKLKTSIYPQMWQKWPSCLWMTEVWERVCRQVSTGVWCLSLRDAHCFSAKTKTHSVNVWVLVCGTEICLSLRDYTARCHSPHVKCKIAFTCREMTGGAFFDNLMFCPIRFCP